MLQLATGTIVSNTVTVEIQLPEFPEASVAVIVTVLTPRLVQSNVVVETDIVESKQLSVLPLSISVESIIAIPKASK